MNAVNALVTALRDPASAAAMNGAQWSAVISVARAEVLLGTLAHRLRDVAVVPGVRAILDDALSAADQAQVAALWEVEMARRALAPIDVTPVLLKGSAYVVAGLPPAPGRQIGDLDILVPRARLDDVEAAVPAFEFADERLGLAEAFGQIDLRQTRVLPSLPEQPDDGGVFPGVDRFFERPLVLHGSEA